MFVVGLTATLARSPGMRTIFLMVISPSKISGTSCSNSRSRNWLAVRDRMMRGWLLFISTDLTIAFDGVALAVEVVGDLLGLGEDQLVFLVVEDQHLFLPNLVNLARDDLADLLRIFP